MEFNKKVCSCFGHSDIVETDELVRELTKQIEYLVRDEGVTTFLFGAFGEFDVLCNRIVSQVKVDFPYIERVLCLSDRKYLSKRNRADWMNETKYEDFVYLELDYDFYYTRIYYRNCEMIRKSDFDIFYIRNHENSGAYKAYKFAKKNKSKIIEV